MQDQDASGAPAPADVEAQLPPSTEEQVEQESMDAFFKEVAAIKVGRRVMME